MSATMSDTKPRSLAYAMLVQYGYILLWIALSANLILINKYVLSYSGFPYPIALTCMHMFFCAVLSTSIVKSGFVASINMEFDVYINCIVPIGLLFAGSLWLGNAAYLYLTVSFIQMLKASMPMVVYSVGIFFGTEVFSWFAAGNMAVVVTGIAIASYGEIEFVLFGVLIQIASIATESVRLTLVQILLQKRGIKLNPITSLYYIAPCCFAFLVIPFAVLEVPKMIADPDLKVNVPLLALSACSAFALNMSIFLLIGKTSALTMNVSGVLKDWVLILLSIAMYGSVVTGLQFFGYTLAFTGVMYYNYRKMQDMQAAAAEAAAAAAAAAAAPAAKHAPSVQLGEREPLLGGDSKHGGGGNGSGYASKV